MIRMDTFTLFLTWRCNFSCGHCGFSCGPERRERLTLARALEMISTVQRNPDLKMIAFSGGEPFLVYGDLLTLVRRAKAGGSIGGVVTNCYWAATAAIAEQRLKELADAGLLEIIVSLDDYHLRCVGLDNIRRVVEAALARSVRVGVNMVVTRASQVRKAQVGTLLGIPTCTFEDPQRIWVRESSPVATGRASQGVRMEELEFQGEELLDRGCPYAVRNIVVTPEERLYACCGFGDTSPEGPGSLVDLGPWGDAPFEELFDRASRNLLLNLVHAVGPYRLLKMAQKAQPGIRFRSRFVSNCDVCREISQNDAAREAIGRLLRDLAKVQPPGTREAA